ncbi:MAG: hypothetical protein AB7P03_20950 [Kofleriaceae bacterium]
MAIAGAAGCGPSSSQIRAAKTASYNTDPGRALEVAAKVTAEKYKVAEINTQDYVLFTAPVWYTPEGGTRSAGAGDFAQIGDRSVQLMMIVAVVTTNDDAVAITVTPKTFQYISGSPKLRELAPDDPNLPGWIQGRVDALQVAIHERMSQ